MGGSSGKAAEPTPTIEPTPTEEPDYIIEEVNKYNDYEVKQLRAAGFTGDEIEAAGAMYVPVEDMLQQAELERQEWLNSAIKPLMDTASPEYKENLKQSWLGLEKYDNISDFQNTGSIYEVRRNLDFEKVDVYGNQLFIKIYLDAEGEKYFFHQLNPSDYFRLENSGNIIVTYQYVCPLVQTGFGYSEDTSRFFIISSSVEIID
jgi:hypothetical protein